MSTRTETFIKYGILKKWHDKDWSDFTNDNAAKEKVLKYYAKLDHYFDKGIGLYLHGENGVGKTLLINLLAKDIFEKRKQTVRIITMGTLIDKYTAKWHGKDDGTFYRLLNEPQYLFIEEIGQEYKSGSSDLSLMVLDSVLRYRLQSELPIIFSTNLSPEAIRSVYTKDISSMLNEQFITIHVTGVDYRKTIRGDMKRDFDTADD